MRETIIKYLEEQCKTDPALVDTYNVDYMDGCIKYITENAREKLDGKNGAIEDAVVYHWAREYFVDNIYKKEAKEKLAENVVSNNSAKKDLLASIKNRQRELKQAEFDF